MTRNARIELVLLGCTVLFLYALFAVGPERGGFFFLLGLSLVMGLLASSALDGTYH
ncbi:MAG: hypothetical protein KGI98_15595 [Euryarchaeota archaeon]|nr:hypothetical protein [Euryarchaeota archaeon]